MRLRALQTFGWSEFTQNNSISKDRLYDGKEHDDNHYIIRQTNVGIPAIYSKTYFSTKTELLLTTKDGVDIYSEDPVWWVCHANKEFYNGKYGWDHDVTGNNIKNAFASGRWTWWSTEELMKAHVAKLKKGVGNEVNSKQPEPQKKSAESMNQLKKENPGLYWGNILRNKADELNGDWQPTYGINKYFIYHNGTKYVTNCHKKVMYAEITYFKSRRLAIQAMKDLGETTFNIIFRR